MTKKQFGSYNILYGVVILAFLLYLWAILKYTAYMPVEDDYSTVLAFLNTWISDDLPLKEKVNMLFYLNADHRLVFANLIILLHYYLFDQANFLYLVIVGNIGWLLIIYLLWRYSRENMLTLGEFLPVILMMLAFSHASLMTWATGALQQYWQLFFAVFSIWLLVRQHIFFAFVVMTVAIFTGGGGFALIPLFALYFFVKKSWKLLGVSLIVSGLIVWFYFIVLDYRGLDHQMILLVKRPWEALSFLLAFLGNFMTFPPLATSVGGAMVLLYLWNARYLFAKMPFVAWSLLYILLTSLLVTAMRFEQGVDFALPSRYAIYSTLFLVLLYIGYIKRYQNTRVPYMAGLVVGVALFLFHFMHKIPAFEQRKYVAEAALAFPTPSYAEKVLIESTKNQIFSRWIGKRPVSTLLHLPKKEGVAYCQVDVPTHDIVYESNTTSSKEPLVIFPEESTIVLEGCALDKVNDSSAYGVILKLHEREGFFYLDRYGKSAKVLFGQSCPYNGFRIPVKVSHLAPGDHGIEVEVVNTFATGYYDALTVPLHKLRAQEVGRLPLAGKTAVSGNIDAVVYDKNMLHVRGWVLQKNGLPIGTPILIQIDGKRYSVRYGIERPDVAKVFGNDSLHVGFDVNIPHIELNKGVHRITVQASAKNRKSLLGTDLYQEFEVK